MRSSILFIALYSWVTASAQQVTVTLEKAIQQALQNNKSIHAAGLDIAYQQQVKRASTDIGKTNVIYMQGQYNSYVKNDNNITVTQSIPFPTVFTTQYALGKSLIRGSELKKAATENELVLKVKQVYYQLFFLHARLTLLERQDSIFTNFVKAADLRYRTGETRLLEKTTAETQQNEARNVLSQTEADILIYQRLLQTLMNSDQPVGIVPGIFNERALTLSMDSTAVSKNPQLAYLKQQVLIADAERKVAGAKFLPEINLGYFNQTLIGTSLNGGSELAAQGDRFQGFQIGLSIPLWFGPQSARVKAAAINREKTQAEFYYNQLVLQGEWQQAVQQYIKNKNSIDYYQASALANAELILRQSGLAFKNGEIDYTEYWLAIKNGIQIRESYLNHLNNLNQSIIVLEFLAGIK